MADKRDDLGTTIAKGLIGPGLLLFMGYLFLTGAIAWSPQLQWLAIIGGGIYILLKI